MTSISMRAAGTEAAMNPVLEQKEVTENMNRCKVIVWTWYVVHLGFLIAAGALQAAENSALANGKEASLLPTQVWLDPGLFVACVTGAIIGTMVKIFANPVKHINTVSPTELLQLLAGKVVVSMGCGLVVTPIALEKFGWTDRVDKVVFTAFVIAVIGDVILGYIVKVATEHTKRRAEELTK